MHWNMLYLVSNFIIYIPVFCKKKIQVISKLLNLSWQNRSLSNQKSGPGHFGTSYNGYAMIDVRMPVLSNFPPVFPQWKMQYLMSDLMILVSVFCKTNFKQSSNFLVQFVRTEICQIKNQGRIICGPPIMILQQLTSEC